MNGSRASKPGVWGIAALAFLLIAGSAAWAQDEPSTLAASDAEDLMGTWDLKMDFQGTPIDMTAVFKEEDGKTVAVVTSAVQPGELVISDIKRDGNSLVLNGAIEMGEGDTATSIKLTINMEIDGDKTTGHVKDEAGLIDADITGGKAVAASDLDVADAEDWLGTWDVSMEFQGTPVSMTLALTDAGGKVAGSLESPTNPEPVAISDITKTDDGLELKYGVEFGGNPVDLVMVLKQDGDAVTGTLGDTNGMFSADLELEKAAGGDAATGAASSLDVADAEGFIGTWDVSMEFQGTPVNMTLTLADAGGKVAASLVSPTSPEPVEITDITKTDDGLEFKYGVEFGGNPVDLVMALKLDGDAFAGTLGDTNGMFSADLTGAKAEGGAAAASAAPFKVPAEDASELDVADAKDYIGGWKLAMEMRGNPIEMTLVMQDIEGKVGAYITSMFAPEPAVIEDIEVSDEGIKMLYQAKFGPQSLDINIVAKLDGGALAGSFADAGGLIAADFTGERLSEDQVVASSRRSRGRGRRGRGDTGETRIKIEGDEIKIAYATLKTDTEDYETLQNAKNGDVFSFKKGRASKLLTETDLKFGDVVIKQGNAHESYPGVYSLWLKKVAGGWHLVANSHADIWGTQHEAEADVAEIPLTIAKTDSEEKAFKIELVEEGMGGTLNIAWGENAWSAKFSVQ